MNNHNDQKPGLARTVVYIALGGLLYGIDEVHKISKENESILDTFEYEAEFSRDEIAVDSLPEDQQARYAAIGMMVRTADGIHRSAKKIERLLGSTSLMVGKMLSPLTGSRVMRPVRDGFENLVEKGEIVLEDWIEIGMKSDKASRQIAKQTVDQATGSVILMVADKPEVQDLIQQQSVGMFQDISENLQGRTAAADTLLERIVFKIIPGSKRDTTPTVNVPVFDEE
jgi:hypothetical protein